MHVKMLKYDMYCFLFVPLVKFPFYDNLPANALILLSSSSSLAPFSLCLQHHSSNDDDLNDCTIVP